MSRTPDLSVVRGSLADPPVVAGGAAVPPRGTGPAEEPKRGELWPGCPVTPLGVSGPNYYYLDVLDQLREIGNHSKDAIRGLFGGQNALLEAHFPVYGKPAKGKPARVSGWNGEAAAGALQRACAERGVWNARDRVRGSGAWSDGEGGLILHCGDRIVYRGPDGVEVVQRPGQIGSHIYPSGGAGPRPAVCSDDEAAAAARALEARLASWNWVRGDLDARLMLGWIVAAMVGGALAWRPMAWITGDKGTGKSELQTLITATLGGRAGLISTAETTPAGVWQCMGYDTLPVGLDEAEAEADNRRMLGLVKLARVAASGGTVLRGGQDHKPTQFQARSCFLFSSILVPPLADQDRSRIALLELREFPPGTASYRVSEREWILVGAQLRRRVFDRWDELTGALGRYSAGLVRCGHSGRGADQYGTLLALADLALNGGTSEGDVVDGWCNRLRAGDVLAQTDQSADWERMIGHLFSAPLAVHRGSSQYTIGEWIAAAAELTGYPNGLDPEGARSELRRHGIGVVGRGAEASIEVANNHVGLAPLFRDTHWGNGVHQQAVKRIPGAWRPEASRSFARAQSRCWVFPLRSIPWILEAPSGQAARMEVEF